MDLDRFKEINDTLGHHFGDQLLIEIGRRLAQTLRESDTVARLGGDEFAVRFTGPGAQRSHRSGQTSRRCIRCALRPRRRSPSTSTPASASPLYPLHAEDADTLMKRADIAMYDAKKNHAPMAIYEAGPRRAFSCAACR